MWEERLKDELEKTAPLEEVCAALREDLDSQHKRRLEAFETKMKPIIIRDGPSRKVKTLVTSLSDLKQKCTQLLTSFLGTVFFRLFRMVCLIFVWSVSWKNHFPIWLKSQIRSLVCKRYFGAAT